MSSSFRFDIFLNVGGVETIVKSLFIPMCHLLSQISLHSLNTSRTMWLRSRHFLVANTTYGYSQINLSSSIPNGLVCTLQSNHTFFFKQDT